MYAAHRVDTNKLLVFLLLLMQNAWVSPEHATWLPVTVDLGSFLKSVSLKVNASSELACASVAAMKNADLYCYQPRKCYLPATTAFVAGGTTDGWNCKAKKRREL